MGLGASRWRLRSESHSTSAVADIVLRHNQQAHVMNECVARAPFLPRHKLAESRLPPLRHGLGVLINLARMPTLA